MEIFFQLFQLNEGALVEWIQELWVQVFAPVHSGALNGTTSDDLHSSSTVLRVNNLPKGCLAH